MQLFNANAVNLCISQGPKCIKILPRDIVQKLRRLSDRVFLTTDLSRNSRHRGVRGEVLNGTDEC